jgi:adenylate cyclase
MSKNLTPEEWWRGLLTGVSPPLPARRLRHINRLIPNGPRCKFCNGPYHGIGGPIYRMIGKGPSKLTPQLCEQCYRLTNKYLGGTEIELTMLFADVRGSTLLAENMTPMEYSKLISLFYEVANGVFIRSEALLNRLVGDQVVGLYVPGFAGFNHRGKAIRAAQELLRKTGHMDLEGPWLPIGVGVHTGVAFVGSVGSNENTTDIAVLGDPPNTAARLSSSAATGEILISEDAFVPDTNLDGLEKRQLTLKGKSLPVNVYVMKVSAS